jgi:hypothetical protein
MPSDSEIRYSADLRLSQGAHAALECISLNPKQYVCETVQSTEQALVDHYLTDGFLASASIIVLVFLVLLKRRRSKLDLN